MSLVRKKHQDAVQALKTLQDALLVQYSPLIRDASIQRFEYTVQAFWKCIQSYLKENEGLICSSPKTCIREAMKLRVLTNDQTILALEMIDDRNLTAHTYHEETEASLYQRLPKYAELMMIILKNVEEKF